MAGAYDHNFLLSNADHINFNQWIDENFHESTSKFDLTEMDPLDNVFKPQEHIDRLGSPDECFVDCDSAYLMSPTFPPAPAAGSDASGTAKAESPEMFDFTCLDTDLIAGQDIGNGTGEGIFEGVIATTLTPAAETLHVASVEPGLMEYQHESQPVKTQVQGHYQLQPQVQDHYQLQPQVQNQYQLPVHTQAQFDGQVHTQTLPYQPLIHQPCAHGNPHKQANHQMAQLVNLYSQRVITSQPDPPQPQPQYHFPTVMPSFNPNPPQPVRPAIEQPRKKYRVPPKPTAQNQNQEWLVSKLGHFTRQYQGYINTPTMAKGIEGVFLSLSHPPANATTTRQTIDPSFPRSMQDYRNCVKQMFDAICDWSSTREWRAKMGHPLATQWVEKVKKDRRNLGLSIQASDLTDEDLVPPASAMPSVDEQWKNVIHRRLSDIEIELLCAKILNEAMLAQEGRNFIPLWKSHSECLSILIHSALRAPWISRITNSPFSETRRKDQNKAGNDRKRTLIEQVENGRKRPVNEQGGGKQKRPRI
ncbi:unnamed protein product [Fusarium venenatum]|uniref:Uncharacterized protein n=1 Tax=Fusarium venenatum TaxID=56646 RepID=A0A2L2U0E8_9HYPO|nr:uncharacterized protein FVRRES_08467 [Fusarium venenatum]CEI68390.1 unnamed protein product [Fusarium venenatum]